jgi:hypothetical protein
MEGELRMEIFNPDLIFNLSKDITLKALDKDLIPVDKNDTVSTAQNIASFYNSISDCLFALGNNN